MRRTAGKSSLRVCLWTLAVCACAVRPGDADVSIVAKWPQDRRPKIQWGSNWDETYSSNIQRWQREIEADTPKGRNRVVRLQIRKVHLLEEMIGRYKPTGSRRIGAYEELVGCLDVLRSAERANGYRRRLVDEFPGRLETAARLLHEILANPGHVEGDLWTEYAADRLIALNAAGVLEDKHEWVVAALRARLDLDIDARRLVEAADALAALKRRLPPGDPPLVAREAEMLYLAGRPDDAAALHDRVRDLVDTPVSRRRILRTREQAGRSAEGVFPRRMTLSARWDALRSRPLDGRHDAADELFAALADGQSLTARGRVHTATWCDLTAYLRRQKPAALAALRKLQDASAPARLAELPAPAEMDDVMPIFRRYPLAASAHKALLAAAERALRRGQPGLARQAFRDVLDYSCDAGSRAAARAGRWTAIAQDCADRSELEAAFEGVDDKATLPWLGKARPAGEIRKRLLASVDPPSPPQAAPALQGSKQIALQMPAPPAWAPGQLYGLPEDALQSLGCAHGQVLSAGKGTLAFAPAMLSYFPAGASKPQWTRTPRRPADWISHLRYSSGAAVALPAPQRPAVWGGRLYCRWGLHRGRTVPTALAAFDLETGRMLWSTAGRPEAGDLQPISQPAVADGRVYALAAMGDVEVNTPIHLVCLAASGGRVLWARLIGHQSLTVSLSRGVGPLRTRHVDVARYGAALTVRSGKVYAATAAGFLAKCDGRDGLVEWTYSYQRRAVYDDVAALVRRGVAAPIVTADRVIFVPRDCAGALALDPATGRLLWDNPFLPSDNVIAPGPGRVETLLLSDQLHLCLADARTGRTVWLRRLPTVIRNRPVLHGGSIYVAGDEGIHRLSAQTGAAVERAGWRGGVLYDFAAGDEGIVGIGVRSGDAAGAMKPDLVGRWRLDRVNPKVYPAAKGTHDGALAVVSRGVLDYVTTRRRYRAIWRSLIRPGVRDVLWTKTAVLLVYRDCLVAFDVANGRVRWRRGWNFAAGRHYALGGYLGLTEADRPRYFTLIDVNTGKLLWRRRYGDRLLKSSKGGVTGVWLAGGQLRVLVQDSYRKSPGHILICDAADGRVLRTLRMPHDAMGKSGFAHLVGEVGFYAGADRRIREFRLGEDQPRTIYSHPVPEKRQWYYLSIKEIELVGQWVHVRYGSRTSSYPDRFLILKRGDPDYVLSRERAGTICGDLLYYSDKAVFTITDLPTKREVFRGEIPRVNEGRAEIIGFREQGQTLVTIAMAQTDPYQPVRLRVDAFDRRGGAHRRAQVLDTPHWMGFDVTRRSRLNTRRADALAPELTWCGETMLIASPHGLRAYGPSATGKAPSRPLHIVQPAPTPVTVDGSLDEWDRESAYPLADASPGGQIFISHDHSNFYVAVAHQAEEAHPWIGSAACGGGDAIELGIETTRGRFRFLVGCDSAGRLRVQGVDGEGTVEALRGAVRHDIGRNRIVYELAMPVDNVIHRAGDWRSLRLSARVWHDMPTPAGRFGDGLAGPDMSSHEHARIHLATIGHRQERAALAILRAVPALDASIDVFREYCRVRARGGGEYERLCTELLRAHARSPVALRLLAVLDQALRTRAADDAASASVLRIAESAGVPAETRKRYLDMTRSYLSQWVYLPDREQVLMVMVALADARTDEARWEHRVFWGHDRDVHAGTLYTPSRQWAGRIDQFGVFGEWVELRVPLIWLDMHDQPIHGVAFVTDGLAYYDRTAVGHTREQVIVDDRLPKGKVTGKYAWDATLAKSGSKSLRNPAARYHVSRHEVADLAEPVTAHIAGAPRRVLPIDRPKAAAALRANLPVLLGTTCGRRYFADLMRLEAGEDLAKKAAVYAWYVKVRPDSPDAYETLGRIHQCYYDLKLPDRPQRMEAVLTDCRVPEDVAYRFRMDHLTPREMYLRNWQVIGPFAAGAIEAVDVDPTREYAGLKGKVQWRLHESKAAAVDLGKVLGTAGPAAACAVCWIHSERARAAVVEFGVDGSGTVLLSRKRVLTVRGRSASARQARARVQLRAGWNEVLVKTVNEGARWRFYFELVSPDGRGMPKGTKVTATPPRG